MSFFTHIPIIGGIIDKVAGRFAPDKTTIIEGQNRINEAEVSGSPKSHLRLWRSFLGWVLSLVFAWEIIGRSVISTYWPHITLPPSVLNDITRLLLGMLGLGI